MWEMGANTWITSALSITSWHLKGYLHCSLLFELNQGEEKQDSQMPLVHFTWNVYWTPPVLLGGGRYPRVTGEDAEAQRGQQWFSVSLSRANLDPYQPLFTSLYMNSTWICLKPTNSAVFCHLGFPPFPSILPNSLIQCLTFINTDSLNSGLTWPPSVRRTIYTSTWLLMYFIRKSHRWPWVSF